MLQPAPLELFQCLEQLNLRDNFIGEMEAVTYFLRGMTQLRDIDMRYNPVVKLPKYRDQVILVSTRLGKQYATNPYRTT